jgi:hypothetical protein
MRPSSQGTEILTRGRFRRGRHIEICKMRWRARMSLRQLCPFTKKEEIITRDKRNLLGVNSAYVFLGLFPERNSITILLDATRGLTSDAGSEITLPATHGFRNFPYRQTQLEQEAQIGLSAAAKNRPFRSRTKSTLRSDKNHTCGRKLS